MKVTREIKKTEAIKRMKALKLFAPCIKAFKDRDEVQFSEITGALYEFSSDTELTEKIREFEKENNALVYHVVHTPASFGDLYNFLYVSDYEEEWYIDNGRIPFGYVLAYVWNKTDEWCSESGDILVQPRFGGLVRIG